VFVHGDTSGRHPTEAVDPARARILRPVSSIDPARPRCLLCGRATFDPAKGERPWVRATVQGHQVLVCPICQEERPEWAVQLDRCERCGATRLSAMLGQVVCRACGHIRGTAVEPAWMGA
jgi:hypothetical protein